ncbi:hypothetical protein NX059_001439 [Plenodomus lindquistii]|nr:hypothetical protein NX059_001439 [Plenodomus lindquistii]
MRNDGLRTAAQYGHLHLISFFLDRGANINRSNFFRGNIDASSIPVVLAVRNIRIGVVRMLLARGAQINKTVARELDRVLCGIKCIQWGWEAEEQRVWPLG